MILRKRKVLVINPAYMSKQDIKTLLSRTRLPSVIDAGIPNGFMVVEVE